MSFGTNAFGAAKPAFGSGFGAPAAAPSQPFQFGATATLPAAPAFEGAFGSSTTQPQQQQASTGFGTFGQQQPQQQTTGTFGAPQLTQNAFGGGGGMFGSTNNAAPASTNAFGGTGLFGQQQQAQSQPQPQNNLFGQLQPQPQGSSSQPTYNPSAAPGQRFPNREQQLQFPRAKIQDNRGIQSYYGPGGRMVPVGVFTTREVGKDETWEIMKREDPAMAQELEQLE